MSAIESEPSDLVLERFVLGELDAARAAAIERRKNEPEIRGRIEAIRRSNEEILRAHRPEVIVRQIERRRAPKRRGLAMSLSFAATAALAVMVVMMIPRADDPTERTKGLAPHVLAWRKTAGEPEALLPGSLTKQGDVLQLGYVAAGARYGVIASLDGRGHATLHFPAESELSTRLSTDGGAILLDEAYELDDAPTFERFFFVTSNEPLDAARVLEALHRLGEQSDAGLRGVPLLAGKTAVHTFVVLKDSEDKDTP